MPLAVPQPRTTSCAQGCASHCSVCAAWGLGVGRGFQGAGGDVARPTAHSAVQRKWDETILPIQQHSPSHKPWQWIPAQSCPFCSRKEQLLSSYQWVKDIRLVRKERCRSQEVSVHTFTVQGHCSPKPQPALLPLLSHNTKTQRGGLAHTPHPISVFGPLQSRLFGLS